PAQVVDYLSEQVHAQRRFRLFSGFFPVPDKTCGAPRAVQTVLVPDRVRLGDDICPVVCCKLSVARVADVPVYRDPFCVDCHLPAHPDSIFLGDSVPSLRSSLLDTVHALCRKAFMCSLNASKSAKPASHLRHLYGVAFSSFSAIQTIACPAVDR